MLSAVAYTGCGKKSYPLKFLAVFSAVAWNFKAKFTAIFSHPKYTY